MKATLVILSITLRLLIRGVGYSNLILYIYIYIYIYIIPLRVVITVV
jgi:hypothetical protein